MIFKTKIVPFCVMGLLLIAANAFAANEQDPDSPGIGSIRGRVVNDDNETLPGATVYIVELNTGVVSDANGFYNFSNLAPGTYRVMVKYVGYTTVETQVTISASAPAEQDFQMSENIELQEVQVTGAFQGQRKALSVQKNGMGVVNVVSADQVGKFPDSNIGDALKRINGVNVQYDQGEARFGQVRGTSADLTSVTINGNRVPSAEGDTRNVQLDLIPADMIQMVELNKVVTADMDGDAIGGEINLVTKNTPYKPVLNFTVGGGYNVVSEKLNGNAGLTIGRRFANNKLGIMAALSFQYNPAGSDNTEFKYDVDKKGNVFLDKAEMRQYYVTRQRQSYSLALDYIFNVNHKISVKGIYNRRDDWENRFRMTAKKVNDDPSKQSMVFQTKAGDESNKDARLERQQTMDFTIDAEHHFGNLSADWAASFSRATEDRPNERYMGVAIKGKKNKDFFNDVVWVNKGERQPFPSSMISSADGYEWSIDELSNSNQNIYENEWKARVNFALPISHGLYGTSIKWGGKFTSKTKDKEKHCMDYTDSYDDLMANDWKQHISPQVRQGFMPGSEYFTNIPFVDKKYLGSFDFSQLEGTEDFSEAAGNFHATENVAAAFLRLDQHLGKALDLTAGLRMEVTDCNYRGFNWIATDATDEKGHLERSGCQSNSYTNWLPSLLLRFSPSDDLKVRASYTKTLARPKYSALVPSISYNVADESAAFGNPELKPTTSHNFDLSSEYYFKSIGLASAGVFYKRLRDVIVEEVWMTSSDPNIPAGLLNADGDAAKFEATMPINAYDADLFGLEFSFQRDFGFLAQPLKCVGLYGTYTFTYSKTRNHNFLHRSGADASDVKMMGSPDHTANLSLYFEKNGINARVSWNTASSFLDELGSSSSLDRYYDKVNYLDVNLSYTWGHKFKTTVFADATNLLNQPLRYYQGQKDRTMQSEFYGPKFNAGIKMSF